MNLATLIGQLTDAYKEVGNVPVMVRYNHKHYPIAGDLATTLANDTVSFAISTTAVEDA